MDIAFHKLFTDFSRLLFLLELKLITTEGQSPPLES